MHTNTLRFGREGLVGVVEMEHQKHVAASRTFLLKLTVVTLTHVWKHGTDVGSQSKSRWRWGYFKRLLLIVRCNIFFWIVHFSILSKNLQSKQQYDCILIKSALVFLIETTCSYSRSHHPSAHKAGLCHFLRLNTKTKQLSSLLSKYLIHKKQEGKKKSVHNSAVYATSV